MKNTILSKFFFSHVELSEFMAKTLSYDEFVDAKVTECDDGYTLVWWKK
jgi:hypothetical protein